MYFSLHNCLISLFVRLFISIGLHLYFPFFIFCIKIIMYIAIVAVVHMRQFEEGDWGHAPRCQKYLIYFTTYDLVEILEIKF
jgi:hypothetical protein